MVAVCRIDHARHTPDGVTGGGDAAEDSFRAHAIRLQRSESVPRYLPSTINRLELEASVVADAQTKSLHSDLDGSRGSSRPHVTSKRDHHSELQPLIEVGSGW